jgi:hypothetical protein
MRTPRWGTMRQIAADRARMEKQHAVFLAALRDNRMPAREA